MLAKWLIVLTCAGILCGEAAHAGDTEKVRRVHDASNRLIGTIERQADGSHDVYDSSGNYRGSADTSGTHDASGRMVSPDRAPEILLPRQHGNRDGATEGRDHGGGD